MKELEDSMVVGDSGAVVRKAAEEEALQPSSWRRLGKPSTNDGNRYRLDIARARVRTGDPTGAMDELARLDDVAPSGSVTNVQRPKRLQRSPRSVGRSPVTCEPWALIWESLPNCTVAM